MNFSLTSSKSSLIRVASVACLLGLLTGACSEPSPSSSDRQEPAIKTESETSPVPISSANIPPGATSSTKLERAGNNNPSGEVETAFTTVCRITQARVLDPNPPLNVRSEPKVESGNIVGTLDNGRWLSVKDDRNGWLQVTYEGSEGEGAGWVAKNRTETSCNNKKEQINFPEGRGSVEFSDRFIGTGSHEYFFKASEGQTLTVTAKNGPLPFIFPPNDPNRQQDLSGGGGYSQKQNVAIELPATGDYLLVFDSNFRGYEYDILIELQ